ncbi:hypothetical protein N0B31_07130 [Salinirubellus salinus]|uniref:Uncharacterized protein n=1 Tax=Salinirubellus salinus TaxID=1364945 RepID=A0A9E7UCB1_9EURY|nr:hypothetical protein [Salinirubellus salinus]UWM56057.1 hypothetical protein N0B31_07130 [Salinirubellus salinus]
MEQSRRALLATLGGATTALAGCSFLSGSPDRSAPTETLSPAPVTPTESASPSLDPVPEAVPPSSLVTSSATDRTYAFTETRAYVPAGGSVRAVFTSAPDADGPATVRATLRNETASPQTFQLPETPVVAGGEAAIGADSRLVLVPTEPNEFVDTVAPVERTDSGLWVLDSAIEDFVAGSVRLGPDETLTGEYVLVGHPTRRRPLAVGRYVFDHVGAPFAEGELARPTGRAGRFGVTVWETDAPGPQELSTDTGAPTPGLPGLERTVWYHATDSGVFLEPLSERVATPQRTVFTLKNHTAEPYRGSLEWRLYKRVDGRWHRLGLDGRHGFAPRRGVAPGDYAAGVVGFHHAGAITDPTRDVTEPFVGPGQYAAVVALDAGTGATGYAARVRLDGPEVTLQPTDEVTFDVDGATVVGRSGEAVPGQDHRVTLAVAPDATADRRLLPEQIMRVRGVRNTLAPLRELDRYDRAVLRTADHVVRRTAAALGVQSREDAVTVAFEGTTYRLATPDLERPPDTTPTPVE